MRIPISLLVAMALSAITLISLPATAETLPPRPKLILVVVIDQFRSDYLLRFESRFLPAAGPSGRVGGFRYLMSHGAYFPTAEYGIAQSMTCPGHATILSGSYPYQAGIPINTWFDQNKGKKVYCAEDPAHTTVGAPNIEGVGTSPRSLIGTTVGDELKNAGLPSRVVSVALKDRAAIMLGGHRADLAFWMDQKVRAWVSSTFYLPEGKLPAWLETLNAEVKADSGKTLRWEAQGKGTTLSEPGFQPVRSPPGEVGKSFPHVIPVGSREALAFPYGLELTEKAAERAFDAYSLGQGQSTDLLALSFSSHDYMGHAFGPNSREMEEMTVAEDRRISKLLNHVRRGLPGGLKDVVIVLTADHGTPPDPNYLKAHRIDAGVIKSEDLTAAVEEGLDARFGKPGGDQKWIAETHDFNIWVNRKAVADRKAKLADVLNEIKDRVRTIHGVAHVITSFDVANRRLPPGLLEEQILHTYFPGRSGDVMIIPRPYYIVDKDEVDHVTGYTFDRMVPLILVGTRLRPGLYPTQARAIDLAPTLAHLANILPPSLSEGRVLSEAIMPFVAHEAPSSANKH